MYRHIDRESSTHEETEEGCSFFQLNKNRRTHTTRDLFVTCYAAVNGFKGGEEDEEGDCLSYSAVVI